MNESLARQRSAARYDSEYTQYTRSNSGHNEASRRMTRCRSAARLREYYDLPVLNPCACKADGAWFTRVYAHVYAGVVCLFEGGKSQLKPQRNPPVI